MVGVNNRPRGPALIFHVPDYKDIYQVRLGKSKTVTIVYGFRGVNQEDKKCKQVMMNVGDDVVCQLNGFNYLDKNVKVYMWNDQEEYNKTYTRRQTHNKVKIFVVIFVYIVYMLLVSDRIQPIQGISDNQGWDFDAKASFFLVF